MTTNSHTRGTKHAVKQARKVETEAVTQVQSLALMKNLVRTAISSIAYLRNLFPESSFKNQRITGMHVKMLKASTDESRLLIKWMELGVFDALEKRFLDCLIFEILTFPEPNNKEKARLLESYTFKMNYELGAEGLAITRTDADQQIGPTQQVSSRSDIRNATVRMIRTLVCLAQTLKGLPTERQLNVKLLYRDEVCPAEYEPKFFREADPEHDVFAFPSAKETFKVRVGRVKTPWHEMSLKVKTEASQFGDEQMQQGDLDSDDDLLSSETQDSERTLSQALPLREQVLSFRSGIPATKVVTATPPPSREASRSYTPPATPPTQSPEDENDLDMTQDTEYENDVFERAQPMLQRVIAAGLSPDSICQAVCSEFFVSRKFALDLVQRQRENRDTKTDSSEENEPPAVSCYEVMGSDSASMTIRLRKIATSIAQESESGPLVTQSEKLLNDRRGGKNLFGLHRAFTELQLDTRQHPATLAPREKRKVQLSENSDTDFELSQPKANRKRFRKTSIIADRIGHRV